MKKINLLFLLIIIIALGVGVFGAGNSINFANVNPFSSDRSVLNQRMTSFLEDIQFKDFKKAASYHSPEDQKNANIPELIESKFFVKPEQMDIKDFKIEELNIDSSGDRARIHTTTHIKLLNTSEMRDIESIFYWQKVDNVWYMRLKSSL